MGAMQLGKIVKSDGHVSYVCQVYGRGEVRQPPQPDDYTFGTFVAIALPNRRSLVGIIYDTMLFNPEFGRLGPRLSPEAELAVFSPDYLNERATLVCITAVGMVDADGRAAQGVPPLAATSDAVVERMADEQIRAFHALDGAPQLAYAPLLIAQRSPLALPLLRAVIAHLTALFPEQSGLLAVLGDDLAWKAQVGPLGGLQ